MLAKLFLSIFSVFGLLPAFTTSKASFPLDGSGTIDDPYTISTSEELIAFSELVNNGTTFENEYVSLEQNLDLSGSSFTPIGKFEGNNYFYGVFNGHGHYVENIYIEGGNVGFFGMLAGTVINFGIESGTIVGACIGSIASHSMGEPYIVNCYSKATLKGSRAGGLVDNYNGVIINSWDCADLTESESSGGLASYSAKRIYNSYSTNEIGGEILAIADDQTSSISYEQLNSEELANRLNSQNLYYSTMTEIYLPLQEWEVRGNTLSFSSNSTNPQTDEIYYYLTHLYWLWPYALICLGFIAIPIVFVCIEKKRSKNMLTTGE